VRASVRETVSHSTIRAIDDTGAPGMLYPRHGFLILPVEGAGERLASSANKQKVETHGIGHFREETTLAVVTCLLTKDLDGIENRDKRKG
jgi:hypothetical protein